MHTAVGLGIVLSALGTKLLMVMPKVTKESLNYICQWVSPCFTAGLKINFCRWVQIYATAAIKVEWGADYNRKSFFQFGRILITTPDQKKRFLIA